MSEFQNILTDIKNRNFIEAYAVFILGILVLVADIFWSGTETWISEITLAGITTLIYLNIKERREHFKSIRAREKVIEGISAFHSGRNSFPGLDVLLRSARKEIFLCAVQHSALVHQYLGVLQERVEDGCKAKILLIAARDDEGAINPNVLDSNKHRRIADLLPSLEANTNELIEWRQTVDVKLQEKIEIRAYWEAPTVTFSVIDKDEIDGFCMVEIFIPGVPLFNLPHYIVTRKDNEDYFRTHMESLNYVWERAKVI